MSRHNKGIGKMPKIDRLSLLKQVESMLADINMREITPPDELSSPLDTRFGAADNDIKRLYELRRQTRDRVNGPAMRYNSLMQNVAEIFGGQVTMLDPAGLIQLRDKLVEPSFEELVQKVRKVEAELMPLAALAKVVDALYVAEVNVRFMDTRTKPFSIDRNWTIFHRKQKQPQGLGEILGVLGVPGNGSKPIVL